MTTNILMSGGPSCYSPRSDCDTSSTSEAIHSGQFMMSKLDDSDNEEGDFVSVCDTLVATPTGFDFGKASTQPSEHYPFSTGPQPTFGIDESLTKLLECLSIAYSGKITSPKWNQFKGVKFMLKDKIRLNNIIWREYHMQVVKKKRSIVVQFASPLTENHGKAESIVMEGKYWKRRLDIVCNEYKRWRSFFRQRHRFQDEPMDFTNAELLELTAKQDVRRYQNKRPSPPPNLDDIVMDFDNFDNFDLFLDHPLDFPNPRDLSQLGNADIMQPGLIQLQPNNLDDYALDMFQTIFQSGNSGQEQPLFDLSSYHQNHSLPQLTSSSSFRPNPQQRRPHSSQIPGDTPNLRSALLRHSPTPLFAPDTGAGIREEMPAPPPPVVNLTYIQQAVEKPQAAVVFSTMNAPLVQPAASSATAVPRRPNQKKASRDNFAVPKPLARRTPVPILPSPPPLQKNSPPSCPPSSPTASSPYTNSADRAKLLAMINNVVTGHPIAEPLPQAGLHRAGYLAGGKVSLITPCERMPAPPSGCITGVQRSSNSSRDQENSDQSLQDPVISAAGETSLPSAWNGISVVGGESSNTPPMEIVPVSPWSIFQLHNQQTTSEQKLRLTINSSLSQLQALLPGTSSGHVTALSSCVGGGGVGRLRQSKATLLHKAAEHIRRLNAERRQKEAETSAIKAEIDQLQNSISACCSKLPATGVAVSRQRANQGREWFDAYVRSSTLQNWKFYIYGLIINDLFESYNTNVSTNSVENLASSVSQWLNQHCSLLRLRPLGMSALRQLSTTTSILTEPSRVPAQAIAAVAEPTTLSQPSTSSASTASACSQHRHLPS